MKRVMCSLKFHHFKAISGDMTLTATRRSNLWCCHGAGGHSPANISVLLSHRSGISNFLRLTAKNLETKICYVPVGLLCRAEGRGWILKHILGLGTLWLQLILFLNIIL